MKRWLILILLLIMLFGCTNRTKIIEKNNSHTSKNGINLTEHSANNIANTTEIKNLTNKKNTIENSLKKKSFFEKPQIYKSNKFQTIIENKDELILSGREVLTITNTNYTMKNNIILKDNSKLIIQNSRFSHIQNKDSRFRLSAQDNSQVIIKNSILDTDCSLPANWNFHHNSILEASNVKFQYCKNRFFFTDNSRSLINDWDNFIGTFCESSKGYLTNSEKLDIQFCWPENIFLDQSFPKKIDYLKLPERKSKNFNTEIIITNSSVISWKIGVVKNSNITIRNSKDIILNFILDKKRISIDSSIDNFKKQESENHSLNTDFFSLNLINTTIKYLTKNYQTDLKK